MIKWLLVHVINHPYFFGFILCVIAVKNICTHKLQLNV